MYTENRETYKLLRKAKLDKIQLTEHMQSLAGWIKKKYGVMPLWFNEDFIDSGGRPRLNVIFERTADEKLFYNATGNMSFNIVKQNAIAKKYRELFPEKKDVWVIYSSFEHSACYAANNKMSKEVRNTIIISFPEIWEVQPFTIYTTVFFYTEKQLKEAEQSGLKQQIKAAYFKLLQQYDEFGYYTLEECGLYFDSKENFDQNFESNWYYYYK